MSTSDPHQPRRVILLRSGETQEELGQGWLREVAPTDHDPTAWTGQLVLDEPADAARIDEGPTHHLRFEGGVTVEVWIKSITDGDPLVALEGRQDVV